MKLRYKLFFIWLIAAWIFILGHACAKSNPPVRAILPSNDTEQIRVNPANHTISILTPSGLHTETLPDHTSTIDVHKDGTVKVTAPQFGFETLPYIGIGFGEGLRLYGGADLGYFKRTDIGLGITTPRLLDKSGMEFNDIRGLVKVSYNIWSNSSVNLGYDTSKTLHCFISVRL